MAEDRKNATEDMPTEWQLTNGKWEYIPIEHPEVGATAHPVSEVIENIDAPSPPYLNHPVADRDVAPINTQDTDDTQDSERLFGTEEAPVADSFLSHPIADSMRDDQPFEMNFKPISDPIWDAPTATPSYISPPIQDDSFAIPQSLLSLPVSDDMGHYEHDRFGVSEGRVTPPVQDTRLEIDGLLSDRVNTSKDSDENNFDEFSDELPLI